VDRPDREVPFGDLLRVEGGVPAQECVGREQREEAQEAQEQGDADPPCRRRGAGLPRVQELPGGLRTLSAGPGQEPQEDSAIRIRFNALCNAASARAAS